MSFQSPSIEDSEMTDTTPATPDELIARIDKVLPPKGRDTNAALEAWERMKASSNFNIELRDEDGNVLLDSEADNATSKPPKVVPVGTSTIAHDQLHAFIQRIERLEEEKAAIAGDIKEIYLEAKGTGFDVKIMRKVVALRKKETAERQEEQSLLDLYLHSLGMAID